MTTVILDAPDPTISTTLLFGIAVLLCVGWIAMLVWIVRSGRRKHGQVSRLRSRLATGCMIGVLLTVVGAVYIVEQRAVDGRAAIRAAFAEQAQIDLDARAPGIDLRFDEDRQAAHLSVDGTDSLCGVDVLNRDGGRITLGVYCLPVPEATDTP